MEILREFLKSNGELTSLPLLLLLCLACGYLARRLKLPSILGYMLGGLMMGPNFWDFMTDDTSKTLLAISHIALGLMSLTIGTHIHFHRLRNSGKRVFACAFFDNLLPCVFVFLVCRYGFNLSYSLSGLLGAVSISTAPATIIQLVTENRARGTLISTLLPMVAINNFVCIIAFGMLINAIKISGLETNTVMVMLSHISLLTLFELLKSIGIAWVMGYALKEIADRTKGRSGELLTGVFVLIMATVGISDGLNINPMLPCLFTGIYLANSGHHSGDVLRTFEEIQHIILVIFFGMAGTHISFHYFSIASYIIIGVVLARAAGKILGSTLGSLLTSAPKRIREYLGLATIPQAGVAIGLIVLAYDVPALKEYVEMLTAVVIVSVSVNEILGPIFVKLSFFKTGEANHDRKKLISFIGEEYIHPRLKSNDRIGAIEELINFAIRAHDLPKSKFDEISEAIIAREKEQATSIGNGIAIPHGIIGSSNEIIGAIGLSKNGIDFEAVDNKKVHLMFLLITPKNLANQHLKILAEIVKLVEDKNIRKKLFASKSAAELYEIIRVIEHEKFNYFIDE